MKAFACIFFAFLFLSCGTPPSTPAGGGHHADEETLAVDSIRRLMSSYNRARNYEVGLAFFDSIGTAPALVAGAQMLQGLGRHAEACHRLDSAIRIEKDISIVNGKSVNRQLFVFLVSGITYMSVDNIGTRAQPALERARELVREADGHDPTGFYPQAMANLANIYSRAGRYEDAIDLCREARELSLASGNLRGAMLASITCGAMYGTLGMYPEALAENARGLEIFARDSTAWTMGGDLYVARAALMKSTSHNDSVTLFLAAADSCYSRAGNPRSRLRVLMEYSFNTIALMPDSVPAALARVEQIEGQVPAPLQPLYQYCRGALLKADGRYREAIPWLIRATDAYQQRRDMATAAKAAGILMDCYLHVRFDDKAADLVPRLRAMNDSVLSTEKANATVASYIRYETERIARRNELLTTELALERSTRSYYIVAGLLLLTVAGTLLIWLVMRHRLITQRHRQARKELEHIIGSRDALGRRNEELARQLIQAQAAAVQSCQLDDVIQAVQTSTITEEERQRFRQSFAILYPGALDRLRRSCPPGESFTRTEELLCMLAMLDRTNEEMARVMGISPRSVSKNRYRIRLKMGWSEGVDVDGKIKGIMSEK